MGVLLLRGLEPLGGFVLELRIHELLRVKAVDYFRIIGGEAIEM